MNNIDWSNVTSGVGLARFSPRIGRYLRVFNPILFDFIVPAMTTGPTSAFRRAADGLEWARPLLTAIWVIFQPFFRPPGRLRDVRWSHIATIPAIQGPSTRQSSPESPVPNRDPTNTDEHLISKTTGPPPPLNRWGPFCSVCHTR